MNDASRVQRMVRRLDEVCGSEYDTYVYSFKIPAFRIRMSYIERANIEMMKGPSFRLAEKKIATFFEWELDLISRSLEGWEQLICLLCCLKESNKENIRRARLALAFLFGPIHSLYGHRMPLFSKDKFLKSKKILEQKNEIEYEEDVLIFMCLANPLWCSHFRDIMDSFFPQKGFGYRFLIFALAEMLIDDIHEVRGVAV